MDSAIFRCLAKRIGRFFYFFIAILRKIRYKAANRQDSSLSAKSIDSKPQYRHSLTFCANLKRSRSTGICRCTVLISNQAAVPAFAAVLC
jgi:hypothetical protein